MTAAKDFRSSHFYSRTLQTKPTQMREKSLLGRFCYSVRQFLTAASAATITTTAPPLESARVFLVTIIVWLSIILATDQHDFPKYRNTH